GLSGAAVFPDLLAVNAGSDLVAGGRIEGFGGFGGADRPGAIGELNLTVTDHIGVAVAIEVQVIEGSPAAAVGERSVGDEAAAYGALPGGAAALHASDRRVVGHRGQAHRHRPRRGAQPGAGCPGARDAAGINAGPACRAAGDTRGGADPGRG